MPSIAVFILVVVFIAIASSKSKQGKNKSTGNNGSYSGHNNSGFHGADSTTGQTISHGRQPGTYASGSAPQRPGTVSGQQGGAFTRQQNINVVPNKESNPMYNINTGWRGDRCSTGFLLNESDHFDESAHPKLGYGQGIAARCHNDWDRVPQGYKVVRCCYCGAGNEVPVRKNGEYKCYFCWKKI